MENNESEMTEFWNNFEKKQRRGKIMGGLLLASIGVLFLGRELGLVIPTWVFTWKMLLIGIGVVLAVKHKFLHAGWIILVGVGVVFILNDIYPDLHIKPIMWPVLLILAGLIMVFKPRRKFSHRMHKHWRQMCDERYYDKKKIGFSNVNKHQDNCETPYSKEDYLESYAIMSGVKKNLITKEFKGGDVINVFGGTELNLTQSDIEDDAALELIQVFGGTKLIVPNNWEIKSEFVTVFGSVEDKRPTLSGLPDEKRKVLRLTGITVFGGIEIKNH